MCPFVATLCCDPGSASVCVEPEECRPVLLVSGVGVGCLAGSLMAIRDAGILTLSLLPSLDGLCTIFPIRMGLVLRGTIFPISGLACGDRSGAGGGFSVGDDRGDRPGSWCEPTVWVPNPVKSMSFKRKQKQCTLILKTCICFRGYLFIQAKKNNISK